MRGVLDTGKLDEFYIIVSTTITVSHTQFLDGSVIEFERREFFSASSQDQHVHVKSLIVELERFSLTPPK